MANPIFNEIKTFAMRGNVVDLAVGFTVGAAFSTIARSLVDDIIMPPVGLLIGQTEVSEIHPQFTHSSLYVVLPLPILVVHHFPMRPFSSLQGA